MAFVVLVCYLSAIDMAGRGDMMHEMSLLSMVGSTCGGGPRKNRGA
jgi:hypothetical protein